MSASRLIAIGTSSDAAIRNQSLDAFARNASLQELLAERDALENFRRHSDNLCERVRALFFLYALHRFHLPFKSGIALRGLVPFEGCDRFLMRRFNEAIENFLDVQKANGSSQAISSALAAGASSRWTQGAPAVTQDIDLWFKDLTDSGIVRASHKVGGFYVPSDGLNPPMFAGESVNLFGITLKMGGLGSFENEVKHAISVSLGQVNVGVLPLERIIASKKAANRDKDKLSLPVLEDALLALHKKKKNNRQLRSLRRLSLRRAAKNSKKRGEKEAGCHARPKITPTESQPHHFAASCSFHLRHAHSI